MPISSLRISGWAIALRNSMEQPNIGQCSPGRTPQDPGCSSIPDSQKDSPRRNHAGLEHNLGPDSGLEKPPPSPYPNPPALPLPAVPPILSDLGQPLKLPLKSTEKKYPLMKQRGFYSDILSPGTLGQLGVSVVTLLPSLSPPCGLHLPILPSTHLFITSFVHLSIHPSICPSINLSITHPPTHLPPFHSSFCSSIHLFTHSTIHY